MCLILTAIAAIICTSLYYFKFSDKKYMLHTLSLMYWGAALMWTVDGFFVLAEGEPFFDISLNDTMLGLLIVASGLALWGVMLFTKNQYKSLAKHTA